MDRSGPRNLVVEEDADGLRSSREGKRVNIKKKVSFEGKEMPRRSRQLRRNANQRGNNVGVDGNSRGNYSLENVKKNDLKGFRIIRGKMRRGPGGRFMNEGVGGVNSRSMGFYDMNSDEIENSGNLELKKLKLSDNANSSKFENPPKKFSRTKSPKSKLNPIALNHIPMGIKPVDNMGKILNYDFETYKRIIKTKQNQRRNYPDGTKGNNLPRRYLNFQNYIKSAQKTDYRRILAKNKGTQKLLQNSSYNNMFEDYEKNMQNEEIRKKYLYNLKKIKIPENKASSSYDGYNAAGISSKRYERPHLRYFNNKKLKNNFNNINVNDININPNPQ